MLRDLSNQSKNATHEVKPYSRIELLIVFVKDLTAQVY